MLTRQTALTEILYEIEVDERVRYEIEVDERAMEGNEAAHCW